MESILVKIITPAKMVFQAEAKIVTLAGEEGVFGVLPNHAPFLASLNPGVAVIARSNDQGEVKYFIDGGVAEIMLDDKGSAVNIVTEFAHELTSSSKQFVLAKIADYNKMLNDAAVSATKMSQIKHELQKYEALLAFV